MKSSQVRLEPCHCPHGVYLVEDICLNCLTATGSGYICNWCGIGGNGMWADDHLRNCAALVENNKTKVVGDDLPF